MHGKHFLEKIKFLAGYERRIMSIIWLSLVRFWATKSARRHRAVAFTETQRLNGIPGQSDSDGLFQCSVDKMIPLNPAVELFLIHKVAPKQ